ncbi:MAG: hypothetical protein ABWK53_02380 [Anaerolineales bacterium]
MDAFDPLTVFGRLLRGWWLMALLALVGALMGRAAALFLPPVYVAQAEYYVSFDFDLFAAEHHLEHIVSLDLREPLGAVDDLIYADEVIADAVRRLQAAGLSMSEQEFRAHIRLDRYYTTWMFTARHSDPQTAARLANAWAQAADPVLQEAYGHAVAARNLSLELALLETCFAEGDLAAGNVCAGTDFASAAEVVARLTEATARLEQERAASRRLDPAIRLELVHLAEVPAAPQRHAAGALLLAGAALGWLAAVVLLSSGLPRRGRPA